MSRNYEPWVLKIAKVAAEFNTEGVYAPSFIMVAKRAELPAETVYEKRRVAIKILRVYHKLELVHMVGENMYWSKTQCRKILKRDASFLERRPENKVECALVSPSGAGKRSAGFYFANGRKDFLYNHLNEHHGKTSGNSHRNYRRRKILAHTEGHIPLGWAKKGILDSMKTVVPPNIGDLGKLDNGENGEQK